MRRFVTLALILVFSIPAGLSISGCAKHTFTTFCNGGSTGETTGEVTNISLDPRYTGVSLNYGSIGQVGSPSATDCKGDSVGVVKYSYGTTNITYADVSPSGSVCAGTWNRNTPGGVADYTTCNPPSATLPIPSTPAFTTPTAPTVTAGATSTLNYTTYLNSSGINGNVSISVGGGATLTGMIANTTTASDFAAAFNAISSFSSAGLVATSSGNTVIVTGPVGVTKTLSFAGTSLAGYVPAAYITASAGGAPSNPVPVYVHPIVTSVTLNSQSSCLSQGSSAPLIASVTGSVNGVPTDISSLSGPLNFLPQDGTVVTINSTVVPPVATAALPGSTIISANTSNASSPAGVFYTCPPKSITLSVPGTANTSIPLNLNTPQALTATVVDTNNTVITGLNLEYVSTSPRTLSASSTGSVTATYPGAGTITAICQPGTCNSSPLNQLGQQGNGLPVTSNPIQITTPGTVNTVLYMASTGSQYISDIDFSVNSVSPPVRLPYVPNSMISDQAGQVLYFGSPSELMEVSTLTNTVSKEDASVKGTVVGVSNDGTELVMSDAVHDLIYIYYTGTGTNVSFGGTAAHAAFTPDNQSVYITGLDVNGNNFFVYSVFDGWHTYKLPVTPTDVSVTVPAIGAYLAGTTTTARSYCPASTSATAPPADFYPLADSQAVPTDIVAATNDSRHILGASATTKLLADLSLTLPNSAGPNNPGLCPYPNGFTFTTSPHTAPLGSITPASITGVLPSADSSIAFVTYIASGSTTTGTVLPAYKPSTTTVIPVTLANGASAPVSGIFSPDDQTFYTGTSGDNLVHLISVPLVSTSPATADTRTIVPGLPLCTAEDAVGNCTTTSPTVFAVPNLLADKPRPTT